MKPSDIEQNNFFVVFQKKILFEISLENYSSMIYYIDQYEGHNFQLTINLSSENTSKIFSLFPKGAENSDGIFILDGNRLDLYRITSIESQMGEFKELHNPNYGQSPKDILYFPTCKTTLIVQQIPKFQMFDFIDKRDALIMGL